MLAHAAVLAQLAIVAHVRDTAYVCDAVEISVAVSAPGAVIPRLTVPSFGPFDLLRASTPRLEFSRTTTLAEYRFIVTTDRAGHVVIPPFEAAVGEAHASSRPLAITIEPPRGGSAPTVVARARIDTSREAALRMTAAAETVYVGQQATYEVAVFLNQAARERLRRNPTFYPPEMQAMLAYDLPAVSAARRHLGSQCFDALVYRRALFPLVAGRLVIPPAQLVYSTALSVSSLLSREESHELQTDSVAIVAVEPPLAGRPVDYTGAVGDVRVESVLDSVTSRVGDPMLFTVRVIGSGNVKLFPRPALSVPWAGLVAADERVAVDSSSQRVGGVKEFDWVLTPRIAGEFDVPPVRYGYFDPARHDYVVATTAGSRVRVAPGSLASADTGHADAALGIRTRYRGAPWPSPQSRPAFWLVLALVPLPALATRVRRRVARGNGGAGPQYDPRRALAAVRRNDAFGMRRHFVRAIAQRLGCNPEDFTRVGALARALRRAGVSQETAARAESVLRALDSAAYAPAGTLPAATPREARDVVDAVDVEALARAELPFWIPAIVVAVSLTVVAGAMAADPAGVHFARGVSAYLRQDFAGARGAFAEAATLEPRSADAWVNFGTAAWSLADTASAVLGWRSALAIEPGASDARDRLTLVRGDGPSSPGWVPPVPRNAVVWTFALLWIAAWAFAWMARREHPWAGRVSLPLAVFALLVGVGAMEIEARVAGGQLAVVRRTVALTSDPAIGMDRGPIVGTGEIVRIAGRRGVWTRVEASEDRDGWIASSSLLAIADRRPRPQ